MHQIRATCLLALCAAFAFGCNNSKDAKPAQESQQASAAAATPAAVTPQGPSAALQAKKLFQSRCVVCHGDDGNGDGPGAAALNPKPRAFSASDWQSSVTDEDLTKVILSGGAAVGKSPTMPGNPDLKSKPEVVAELVKIVRNFNN